MNRRTLIRGAGVSLALPWLEAMMPSSYAAKSKEEKAPVRMAVLWKPNGVREDLWTPDGEGVDFELSSSLESLEKYKKDLFIPTHLWNQGSKTGDGHYVKVGAFLTGTTITKTKGVDLNCNGISMDQFASKRLGFKTPIPSLELGIEPARTGIDGVVGYTRVYGAHIAWAAPRRPLAKETNPRLVFERLLRSTGGLAVQAKRDASLLDLVLQESKDLKKKLGRSDQRRMDEYLDSVRSVEERLQKTANPGSTKWKIRSKLDASMAPDQEVPRDHQAHVRLMLDMVALSFQTDMTRIATFMFGNAVSDINFSFLDGVKGSHHGMSHHEKKKEKLTQYHLINQWHVEQYAYLLEKLRNIQDGEQTLLHNSMVLFGSSLRDGNGHRPNNLPLVLAGQAGGRIQTGQHRTYSKDSPLADMYVSMLDAFGAPTERF
ncbi:DUF1552 domain-containing protein, partial [Verrucomicrobia bacterium]|nr:DUF1552 domain-containing protein [Verrucomicrobiota bacterium]